MKKKLMALIMGTLMVTTILGGCNSNTANPAMPSESTDASTSTVAEPPVETPAAAGGKYALVMSHMSNAFVTTFAEAAKEKAAELGVELIVFDGNKDSATQIGQIESVITQGYAGIMVEPVSVDGIRPAVEAANNAGIPIITVVQQMTQSELIQSHIGGDDMSAGKLEMEKAIEGMGGKGKIAILYGPMGSDAMLIRKEGYDTVLAQNPDVEVVFDQTANWVTDEALKIVENWLQSGKKINAIVSQNDGMAIGAVKAVEDAKLNDSIMVYGIDATPDGISAISAGRMEGTVSQNVAGQGKLAMETIVKLVAGDAVDEIIQTPPEWVTRENVTDYE